MAKTGRKSRSSLRVTKSGEGLFHVWWKVGDDQEGGLAFSSEAECKLFIDGFQVAVRVIRGQVSLDDPEVTWETK